MDEFRINKISTGKPRGMRSFGRLQHKPEDITMNLTERECEGMALFQAAQHDV
jgi:hypothetical protein